MMDRQGGDQSQLFYLFNLERRIPTSHLLRRINPVVTRITAGLCERLAPFYSEIDPELMFRMSLFRMDCEGEQARPIWLWPQLYDRHGACCDRRC
jgi:hypothetical protein